MGRADKLIKMLLPREERFHELLGRDTENLVRAVHLFSDIANTQSFEDRRVKAVQLKALEHEGDGITRQVFEALNSSFITPFDRDDIRSLAMDLDDILDFLEGVAQYLVILELRDAPQALRQFAEILVAMVEEIHKATALMWHLGNEARIQAAIVHISELENQADSLYNTVIADLFKGDGRSPIEIMKWKEVYDQLEDACDACKDFTHILGNVVVKNA
jgi:predicted phosphate transport protein (TIGR00153 family)